MTTPVSGYTLQGSAPKGICIPNPVPRSPSLLASFTIEHWLYLNSDPGANGLLAENVPNSSFISGPLVFYISGSNGPTFTVGSSSLSPGASLPVGEWIQLAWVFTGTHRRIYKNGALVADGALSEIPAGCGFFHCAFHNDLSPVDGQLARLRFWNKAMTATDVAAAKDATYDASEPNLIVQYNLDEPAPDVFGKPDRAYQYALLLNRDSANADNLVANRMGHVYPAPAHERPKQTEISGIITDADGQPCQRKVYAVTRPTDGTAPEVVAHGLSDPATGEYTLDIPTTAEVSRVVVSEDDESPLLNDLIDRIIPA